MIKKSEKSINIENIDNKGGTINFYVNDKSSQNESTKTIPIAAVDSNSTPLEGYVEISPYGEDLFQLSFRLTEKRNNQQMYQKLLVFKDEKKAKDIMNKVIDVFEEIQVDATKRRKHSAFLIQKAYKLLSNLSKEADIGYHDNIDDSIRLRFDNNQFDSHQRDNPMPYGWVGEETRSTYTQGVSPSISEIVGVPTQYSNPNRSNVLSGTNTGIVSIAGIKKTSNNESKLDYTFIYDRNDIKIVKVVKPSMAVKLSKNAYWGIVDEEYASRLLSDGPLYFIAKSNKKYAFLHVETKQIRGVDGRELTKEEREELKQPIIDSGIVNAVSYEWMINKNSQYKPKENEFQYVLNDPKLALHYSIEILKRERFRDGEEIISNDPSAAYKYGLYVLRGERVPVIESGISVSGEYSYEYASNVLKGRFEEGENSISKNIDASYKYAFNVLKGRFELGEKIIGSNPKYAFFYAKEILKGERVPLIEKSILSSEYREDYIEIFQIRYPDSYKDLMRDVESREAHQIVPNSIIRLYNIVGPSRSS